MISIECRCSNPETTSASFGHISVFDSQERSDNWTHETKTIGLAMSRYEVHNISINHPLGDDA